MKKPHRVVLLYCICLPFFGQAQTAQVCIAKTNYPAEFLDANLSFTNRQRIATDLTLVFSLAPSFENARERREIENGVFKPNIDISMFGWDEKSEGIFLVEQNNQKSIRIDKVASDLYLKSFALMKTHSNAVQKAHEFVTMLNHTNLLALPIQDLRGLFHPELLSKEDFSDDEARALVTGLQKHNFLGISVLNVFLQRVPQVDNAEVLVMGVYMVDKINPSQEKSYGWTFDFYKGKWGFGRVPFELQEAEMVE